MIEDYLRMVVARGKSENTLNTYRFQLDRFFSWAEAGMGIVDPRMVTSAVVMEYRQYLQSLGKKPNTINTVLASIKTFYTWMSYEGYIHHNPKMNVEMVKKADEPVKWLNQSEAFIFTRIAKNEKDRRNWVIVLLLLYLGLRVSELCELKPEDILIGDKSGYLSIRQGGSKKHKSVSIPKDFLEPIGRYIIERRATGKYLFCSQRGEQLTTRAVQHLCVQIGLKARISRRVTPTLLRNTFQFETLRGFK